MDKNTGLFQFQKSFQYSSSIIKKQYNEALGWIREMNPLKFAHSANEWL